MKRVILAAVFIVTISGFAAAQSTSAKSSSKQVKTTTVKRTSTSNSKQAVLKQENSSDAKSDVPVKLLLTPMPAVSDSTAMPVVKNGNLY